MLESGWYSPASASSTEDLEQSRALMALPYPCIGSPDIDFTRVVNPSDVYKPLTDPVSPSFINMREDSMSQCSSVCSENQGEMSRPSPSPVAVVLGINNADENSAPEKGNATIYQRLTLGMEEAVAEHGDFIVEKFRAGLFLLPLKQVDPNSKTPYSDVAKPRKKGKDGAPKRPMNAFMVFSQCERQKFISARASLDNAKISTHLGPVWKSLPAEVHKPYEDFAAWLKELHSREFPGYKYKPRKKKGSTAGSKLAPADKPKAIRARRGAKGSTPYNRPPLKVKQEPANVFPAEEDPMRSVSPASAVTDAGTEPSTNMMPSPLIVPCTLLAPVPPPPPSVAESIPSPGDHRLAADPQTSYAHRLLAEMRDGGPVDFTANLRIVQNWEEENMEVTPGLLDSLADTLFPDNDSIA